MKRVIQICILLILCFRLSPNTLLIGDAFYQVDTIANFNAGPGTQYIQLRLTADNRLDVYFLKVNTTNPHVTIKAALGRDSIYGGERPSAYAARKSTPESVYFAGANADFYNVSDYIGYPLGGCVVDDEVVKVPVSDRRMIAFEEHAIPDIGIMAYTGNVKYGDQTWTIDGVNHLRGTDQLILYNQYNGKITRTNNYGTEVLLKLKTGESWGVSKTITAVVQAVNMDQGGIAIPNGYAVLSGHGAAALKLNNLSVNDEVQLTMDMMMNSRKYNVTQMVGGDSRRPMLEQGVVANNEIWNELHPRTAIGYSADKTNIIICVVDGRGVSAGVTTKELAQLMKSAGAYTALNLDGGGSTCMYIKEFGPVNDYSDATERAVGNSIFAVSLAPTSTTVSSIKPYNPGINLRPGETVQPAFIAYDVYGNIVNNNLQNVILSCDPSLGSISNGVFSALGVGKGVIHAQYGGLSTQIRVNISDSQTTDNNMIAFSDNFNRTSLSPGGEPKLNYTIAKTGTASPAIASGVLTLSNIANESARTLVMASNAAFLAPYSPVLSSIKGDSVVWLFNMRHNYNGRLSGIDDAATRGVATILASSSSDMTTANGYALINGGASPINYRLVKFSNGLTTASNITVLKNGQTLSENRSYMSIKVVYVPATNMWKLYDRVDGGTSGVFEHPLDDSLPYSLAGTVVDATHTNIDLSYFGFFQKYGGSLAFNYLVDNYIVRVFKSDNETGVNKVQTEKFYKLTHVSTGVVIETQAADVVLFDIQGKVLNVSKVKGQAEIHIEKQGIYLLKVISPEGKIHVEKVLFMN